MRDSFEACLRSLEEIERRLTAGHLTGSAGFESIFGAWLAFCEASSLVLNAPGNLRRGRPVWLRRDVGLLTRLKRAATRRQWLEQAASEPKLVVISNSRREFADDIEYLNAAPLARFMLALFAVFGRT
ncbi:MAG: hypothetical protein WAJ85_06500 [Candidatus Baltobacteraceae bacterium]|jgi:hypothetical protein